MPYKYNSPIVIRSMALIIVPLINSTEQPANKHASDGCVRRAFFVFGKMSVSSAEIKNTRVWSSGKCNHRSFEHTLLKTIVWSSVLYCYGVSSNIQYRFCSENLQYQSYVRWKKKIEKNNNRVRCSYLSNLFKFIIQIQSFLILF